MPAVKLQATASNGTIFTTFHLLEIMHEKYQFFTFHPPANASVM